MPSVAVRCRTTGPRSGPTNSRRPPVVRKSALPRLSPACLGAGGRWLARRSFSEGVSNPVAPTTSLRNPRKHHTKQHFSARALFARFRQESPSTAAFCIGLAQISAHKNRSELMQIKGGCCKAAARSGPTRRCAARCGRNFLVPNGAVDGLRSGSIPDLFNVTIPRWSSSPYSPRRRAQTCRCRSRIGCAAWRCRWPRATTRRIA